jgi:hypothetical protein
VIPQPVEEMALRTGIDFTALRIEPVIDILGRKRGLKAEVQCPVCNQKRWLDLRTFKRKAFSGMCRTCHNKFTSGSFEDHPRWKGGRNIKKNRYVEVRLKMDDPFYSMARKSGYILEHRYVMAKHLNRILLSVEIVHHINREKTDNRIENLELLNNMTEHLPSMVNAAEGRRMSDKITKLKNTISKLRKENVQLKQQIEILRSF